MMILTKRWTLVRRFRRWSSTTTVSQPKSNDQKTDSGVQESAQRTVGDLDPVPIQSLNILQRVERFTKEGSVFRNIFLGKIDHDLLSFPFLLKNRQEFLQLTAQYEMVRKTWNHVKKDDETLDLLKYNSLYELSVSEMMFVFEAIGASIEKNLPFGTLEDNEIRGQKRLAKTFERIESRNPLVDIEENAMKSFHSIREAIQSVIPLLERNAICNYALNRSSNENIRNQLTKKTKIAFAYQEEFDGDQEPNIDPERWSTTAQLTFDQKSWLVTGRKNNIIESDSYTHYLVFAKADKLTEMENFGYAGSERGGLLGLLIPTDTIKVQRDYHDYFGIPYQKIEIDHLELNRDQCEVIKSTWRDISEYGNVKGCGQLAVSAVILGLLKQLQKNTYAHLVNNRIGLTKSELVQYKLYRTTAKIYALESMIYLTAAMYDSFERGTDFSGETITAKTLAIEYANEVITELRSLFGARYPFSSVLIELIYYLDGYLDSSLNNRMYLGREAVKHYYEGSDQMGSGRVKNYFKLPIYNVKQYLLQRKLRNNQTILSDEITKYIHHNMHPACQWIEHCLNLCHFSLYYVCNLHEKNVWEKHLDLDRLATMAMDINMMVACLSRANHSLCYGLRNNHTEKEICMAICKEIFMKHLDLFEKIDKRHMAENDQYAKNIFEMNLQHDGYFPRLFEILSS